MGSTKGYAVRGEESSGPATSPVCQDQAAPPSSGPKLGTSKTIKQMVHAGVCSVKSLVGSVKPINGGWKPRVHMLFKHAYPPMTQGQV